MSEFTFDYLVSRLETWYRSSAVRKGEEVISFARNLFILEG